MTTEEQEPFQPDAPVEILEPLELEFRNRIRNPIGRTVVGDDTLQSLISLALTSISKRNELTAVLTIMLTSTGTRAQRFAIKRIIKSFLGEDIVQPMLDVTGRPLDIPGIENFLHSQKRF